MRIAVVTESFLPRVNGVTNSVCRILEHFEARGHEALVITPRPGPGEYRGYPVLDTRGVRLPGYREFVVGLPTARLEKRLRGFGPDVVHLASPIALGAAGVSAARKLDVPTVAAFQTDVAGFARRYGLRGTDRAIWSWLRHVHRHAARTLVPSTASLLQLRAQGIPRLALWRRGVDSVRFHPRHRDPRLRAELAPNREVIVGYVGRLSSDKRVNLLAHIADLPNTKLVIAGDGPAAKKLRGALPDAVFTGFLHGEELSRLFASLDVFIHTGADETFCQTIQEAMASGVPVVAPAAGGPLDLVEHGRTGMLYAPDSVDELRAGLAALTGNPLLRAGYGARSRERVVHRTWPSICDELLGHYSDVVSGREPAEAESAA